MAVFGLIHFKADPFKGKIIRSLSVIYSVIIFLRLIYLYYFMFSGIYFDIYGSLSFSVTGGSYLSLVFHIFIAIYNRLIFFIFS